MIVVMTECDERTATDPLRLPIGRDQGTEKSGIKIEIVNGNDRYQEREVQMVIQIVGPRMAIETFKGTIFDEIDIRTFKTEIVI